MIAEETFFISTWNSGVHVGFHIFFVQERLSVPGCQPKHPCLLLIEYFISEAPLEQPELGAVEVDLWAK